MKHPASVDIAVLILFFNRPKALEKVFAAIREARPARLYLYQDGARGERDIPGIDACRQVVADEQIDWECDVRRNYREENSGCDPSNFNAQKWAFSLSDKVVVFEDDSIPSVSFIRFCKEMLDRYEDDERITLISGFNADEVTPNVPDDYFFTSIFSIWGWASWRRVIDQWDEHYTFLEDAYNLHQLRQVIKQRKLRKDIIPMCINHRASEKAYYESIFWTCMLFNNGLAIMPTKNMINNVGATANSTHYSTLDTMPRRLRRLFTMRRFELEWPLRHPKYVIENIDYKESVYRTNAWNHPWIKVRYSLEELWYNIRRGNVNAITKAFVNRLNIWTGRRKHK